MAYKAPLSFRIKNKAKTLWRNLVKDWKFTPYKEKPAGFLVRSFRKAVLASAAVSLFGLGIAFLCGNWTERAYRGMHGDPYKLSLAVDTDKVDSAAAPLYVGSAESKRIIAMQEDLLTLNLPLGECGANGDFTKQDLRAVNWFRTSVGLPAGEFVDERTLKTLAEQAAKRRTLMGEFGDASTEQSVLTKSFVNPSLPEKARIRQVEADLFQLGYKISSCKVDGVMDDQDVTSVMAFQEKTPGLVPNGAVDYKTYKALQGATYQSLVASGQLDAGRAQGLDDLSLIINGAQMSPEELEKVAKKYVRERGAPEYIVNAVKDATQQTGFDFTYMMDIAYNESGYKPWVGAGTSSAYGNFQFTDGTWLTVFGTYGEKYAYGSLSKKIHGGRIDPGTDPKEAKYIMDLRNDPKVAALMAIELSKSNLAYLQGNLGGAVGRTDLYIAHFLGPGGGLKFAQEFRRDNTQNAAKMFPDAAAANQAVFYDNGRPRSLGEIYASFSRRLGGSQVLRMVAPQAPKRVAANTTPGNGRVTI